MLLGVASLVLVDLGAYAVSQAFTSTHVIINVEGDVLLMAVVAGYVARLVAFTPGGLGQWEWAFAAALYAGGLGLPRVDDAGDPGDRRALRHGGRCCSPP